MEKRSLDTCRLKAIILMMLATGRRLEEVQALTKAWRQCVSQDGTNFLKFSFYDSWKGKAESLDGWHPHDITLFTIDQGENDPDLSALCLSDFLGKMKGSGRS